MGFFGTSPQAAATGRGRRPSMYTLLATGLLTYLASHPQALSSLMGRLKGAGLEKHVDSWTSTGPNKKVLPEEVEKALGPNLHQIAQESGVTPEEAKQGLTEVLPNVVDKLTPHGEVPPPNILEQGINFLRNSLFSHPQ